MQCLLPAIILCPTILLLLSSLEYYFNEVSLIGFHKKGRENLHLKMTVATTEMWYIEIK